MDSSTCSGIGQFQASCLHAQACPSQSSTEPPLAHSTPITTDLAPNRACSCSPTALPARSLAAGLRQLVFPELRGNVPVPPTSAHPSCPALLGSGLSVVTRFTDHPTSTRI